MSLQISLVFKTVFVYDYFINYLHFQFLHQKFLLLRIGGNATSPAVFSIMYKLFSIKMGASYTWTGKTKKGGRKQVFGEFVNMVSVTRGNKTFSIKVKSACIKQNLL